MRSCRQRSDGFSLERRADAHWLVFLLMAAVMVLVLLWNVGVLAYVHIPRHLDVMPFLYIWGTAVPLATLAGAIVSRLRRAAIITR